MAGIFKGLTIGALLLCAQNVLAQELEPRRWSHLPVGLTFGSAAYLYTDTDIEFDPALEIENARGDIHTFAVGVVHTFGFFGKSARIDAVLPYSVGRWEGSLEGEPASTRRSGINDPKIRFAVNLVGSPALSGKDFAKFEVDTIVGAAVEVRIPLGEYQPDKLINLGSNRWVVRPQLGVTQRWGQWDAELTGSVWFYGDNKDFDVDKRRKQDPLFSAQTHLIYTFRPGLWFSGSLAFGGGAQSEINGIDARDRTGRWLYALSTGLPVSRTQGVTVSLIGSENTRETGSEFLRILVGYSKMWGAD